MSICNNLSDRLIRPESGQYKEDSFSDDCQGVRQTHGVYSFQVPNS